MEELLTATQNERARLFEEAYERSARTKSAIIIEKDFWVCWTLNRIFTNPKLAPHIIFKGGTSLSKCYGMIDRFSEDLDLTLSKTYIGITRESDPITASTSSQRGKRLIELSTTVTTKIINDVKPMLNDDFKLNLSPYFNESEWKLTTDESDAQTLLFHYPSSFDKNPDGYIQRVVKLELGARGDNNPCDTKRITPYAQEYLPELFTNTPEIKVTALTAKRTFWEKVTLLHAEYHRDPQKSLPGRLFRHYYDIVMLDQNNITHAALQDISLLDDVLNNKVIYFPSKWANYDTAKIGSLRLCPNSVFLDSLREDSKQMDEMFFDNMPDFDSIMSKIEDIEKRINTHE